MNGEMVQAITVALAVAKAGWNVAAMERCSAAGCPLGAGTCPAVTGSAQIWAGREVRPVAAVVPCFMVDMMAAEEGERPFGPCANCRGAIDDDDEAQGQGRNGGGDHEAELFPEIAAAAEAAKEREPSREAIAVLDQLGMLSRREAVAVMLAMVAEWTKPAGAEA